MIYKLNNEEGVEQGLIETSAPEDVVQSYWLQVANNVYLFHERRHIESVNNGVAGTQTPEELVILLQYVGYASVSIYTGNEPSITINASKL